MPTNRIIPLVVVILTLALVVWSQPLKEVPANAVKRGDHAPPLAFKFVVNGPPPAEINWQALHGKVVVLDFWGTWCAPCVAGIPHLNELAAHYSAKPVQFVAVGHENPEKVAWFLKKHPIDAWIGLDTDLAVYKAYAAFGIPHAVIVDQNGIVGAVLNPKDLTETVIDAVLAGETPVYPPLPGSAYWNPETSAEYFLQKGAEKPPTN